MLTATADTNVYISALQYGGRPQEFLARAEAGDFRLDISDAILHETLRVLREKFGWPEDDLRSAEATLAAFTRRVTPTQTLDIIQVDPPDNRILECAAAAKSDYIVTGDKRHILPLGTYAGIPIVKVADFLGQLQERPGRER